MYNLTQTDCFMMQNRNTKHTWIEFVDVGHRLFSWRILWFGDWGCRRDGGKVPIVTPNEPATQRRVPKKVQLGIFTQTRIWPQIRQQSNQWFALTKYQDNRQGFSLANCEYGLDNRVKLNMTLSFPLCFGGFWGSILIAISAKPEREAGVTLDVAFKETFSFQPWKLSF